MTIQLNPFPDRIPTGVGRQTIPVPKGFYCGHPDDFEFGRQTANYVSLKAILEGTGVELTLMSACPRHIKQMTQMRFVVVAGDVSKPDFIWEKYEGGPSSGQNRVYVDGRVYRLSYYLSMDELRRAMTLIKV